MERNGEDDVPPTKRRKVPTEDELPSGRGGMREIFSFSPLTTAARTLSSNTITPSFWIPDSPFIDGPSADITDSEALDNRSKGPVKTFKTSAAIDTTYNVKLNDTWMGMAFDDALKNLNTVFTNVLQLTKGDLTRVVFKHPDLETPLVVSSRREMTANDILKVIENALTSHADLHITHDFQIVIGVIDYPKGSGKKKYVTNLVRDLPSKNSIVQIKNDDNMCGVRATAVAYVKSCLVDQGVFEEATKGMEGTLIDRVLKSGKATASFYRNIRKGETGKQREQLNMSLQLCRKAGISIDDPCSLADLDKLEKVINRNICVIEAEEGNKFVRKASNPTRENIYLYLHDGHFDAIVSMTGFFSCGYFCRDCLQPFSNKNKHRCETHCNTCMSKTCQLENLVNCPDCNQVCRGPDCVRRHKLVPFKISTMCEAWYRCLTCQKVMSSERKNEHQCGEWYCKSCERWVNENHLCYIRAVEPEEHHCQFVFYDIETTQETKYICETGYVPSCSTGCCNCEPNNLCSKCSLCVHCANPACNAIKHVPNLVVAKTVCDTCLNLDTDTCEVCGRRCKTCKDQTCVQCPKTRQNVFRDAESFCQWLFSEQYKNFTCIAHNAKAFDSYFILDYLSKQGIPPANTIYNGTKIMYFTIEKGLNLRFVDSLNFFAMPLSKLPKAFGFDELKKGYFPHHFNKFENRAYVGTLPDPSYYGVDDMTPDGREAFLAWHAKRQTEGPFDFDGELVAYCKSDVDILSTACLQYRRLMIDATGVDPWTCVTVASTSMKVYKTNFLREHWTVQLPGGSWHDAIYQGGKFKVKVDNGDYVEGLVVADKQFVSTPIARVPATGYSTRVTYSRSSIQWLEWLRHSTKTDIRHALNGRGEDKVGGHYVDGLAGQTVYEFNGCFWHGCPECYKVDRSKVKHPRTQQSMNELYALTCKKRKKLETLGYTVVSKWEHEFHEELKTNPDMKNYVDSLDLVERLNPRDSFFGGRTNALRLHYKVKPDTDEEIRYVDFTSLYPYVNKYKEYPVGHPEIVTGDFKDITEYFGIAKVKILPPRGLYLPVLPYKSNGKLKFPLCRTCADTECQTECECTDEQRAMTGTWCTVEIIKALKMGYTLLNIYEVYHFKEKSHELFSEYVNTFLKYKQESSDFPQWCTTEETKTTYIDNYRENEGVELDRKNIEKNPGLRSLAKSKLNNFWGKFGQRNNFTKTSYFTGKQLAEFFVLISDTSKEIKNFHIVNENLIVVEYCDVENQCPDDSVSNVFIASFTTAHARLHLYDVMEPLGERVLYHDTDSIIYVHVPSAINPNLGDYLGQLTDELAGDPIIEFVSAGPKNYAYKTKGGQEACKVRGFRLNYTNSRLVNFDVVKNIVTHDQSQVVKTLDKKILRDKVNIGLFNKCRTKIYKLVYTKRRLQGECTLPYGY